MKANWRAILNEGDDVTIDFLGTEIKLSGRASTDGKARWVRIRLASGTHWSMDNSSAGWVSISVFAKDKK